MIASFPSDSPSGVGVVDFVDFVISFQKTGFDLMEITRIITLKLDLSEWNCICLMRIYHK